jgi:redox-sensitive bicupin YhaK (pirin superfamily)
MPNTLGVKPRYDQRAFARSPGGTAILHPDAAGAMQVYSDARLWRYIGGSDWSHRLQGKQVYVHGVTGTVTVNGQALSEGDGIALEAPLVSFEAESGAEALVFDLD